MALHGQDMDIKLRPVSHSAFGNEGKATRQGLGLDARQKPYL